MAEELNAREDANEDVRAAIAQLKGGEPETELPIEPIVEAAPELPEPEPKANDRARDESGKFVAKSEPKPAKDAAPAKAAAPAKELPPSDNTKASASQPSTAASAPPVSWAADAKGQWASLP